jgi:hypothetical protein
MNSHSSQIWKPLPVQIEIAEVIFDGILIDIYSQKEPEIINQISRYENGNIIETFDSPPQIYTTYVFEIKNILKGEYFDEQIEIKMLGGCDKETDDCVNYSFNYGYKLNDRAVMFVNLNKRNNYYKRSGYSSAYTLKGSLGLLTRSGYITYFQELDDNNKVVSKEVLTLDILKNEIYKLEIKKP